MPRVQEKQRMLRLLRNQVKLGMQRIQKKNAKNAKIAKKKKNTKN